MQITHAAHWHTEQTLYHEQERKGNLQRMPNLLTYTVK